MANRNNSDRNFLAEEMLFADELFVPMAAKRTLIVRKPYNANSVRFDQRGSVIAPTSNAG
jgi:hypothetical protein